MQNVTGLSLCVIAFACVAAAQHPEGPRFPVVDVGFAASQVGSPVTVTHVTVTKDFPFDDVTIKNVGSKTVETVELGIVIDGIDESGLTTDQRTLVKGGPVRVSMRPEQGIRVVSGRGKFPGFFGAAKSIDGDKATATLGVVLVQFVDGSIWDSGVTESLHFPMPETLGIPGPCVAEHHVTLLASADATILPIGLTCKSDSQVPTNCQVIGSTSCVMHACGCPNGICFCGINCECKRCQWEN